MTKSNEQNLYFKIWVAEKWVDFRVAIWGEGGQPFTYDLFDALRPSEFERVGSWFARIA